MARARRRERTERQRDDPASVAPAVGADRGRRAQNRRDAGRSHGLGGARVPAAGDDVGGVHCGRRNRKRLISAAQDRLWESGVHIGALLAGVLICQAPLPESDVRY